MLVKNISGRPQKIITYGGVINIAIDEIVNLQKSLVNTRYFIEVNEDGSPKSANVVAYVTEDNKKAVVEAVVEPVAKASVEEAVLPVPAGKSEAIVSVDDKPKPRAYVKKDKEPKVNTLASVLGQPNKE